MDSDVKKFEPMRTRDDLIDHIAMLVAQPLAARTNATQILDYISEDVLRHRGPFIVGTQTVKRDRDGFPKYILIAMTYGSDGIRRYEKSGS